MVKCTNSSLYQETNKFAMYNVLLTKMCQNEMSYIIWMEKDKFYEDNYWTSEFWRFCEVIFHKFKE